MLTRHEVGHRVAIRTVTSTSGGRPVHSDLVGRLTTLTDTAAVLRTRTGTVQVPLADIRAARRIPDRRSLTATERLERVAAAGWPAPSIGHLGDWLLRAGGGWTARANSALPVGDPDLPLPEAVDRVVAWYRKHGQQPAIMVPEPVGGRLTAELERRDWQPDPPVLVQTAELAETVARATPGATGATATPGATGATATPGATGEPLEVRLDRTPPAPWLAIVAGYKPYPSGLPDAARQIITGVPRARFAGAYTAPAVPVAVARGVIADDDEWLGISLVEVNPAQRRRGLASALAGALAQWAVTEGAHRAYLQVEAHNEPAIRLYARLGFATHHRYTTWRSR